MLALRCFPRGGRPLLRHPAATPALAFKVPSCFSQAAFKASVPRDPDRPKAPLSAYLRFSQSYREKHGLKGGVESMRKMAAAWKSLTPMEKKPFQDIFEKERTDYQSKLQQYEASGKAEAWKRDPARPKRPLTPFFRWAVVERSSPNFASVYGKLSVTEATKALATQFKALPADKTSALQAQFKAEMEKYKVSLEKYKASGAEEAWLEKTGRLEAKKREAEKKKKEAEKRKADREKKKAATEKKKAAAAKKREREKEAKKKKSAAAAEKAEKAKAAKEKAKAAKEKAAAAAKEKAKAAAEKAKEKSAKAKATKAK